MTDENTAKTVAAKERVVSHMNKDHHDSIIRYLRHYHGLSPWAAYDSQMTSVDLDSMTFACSGRTYHIPFQPPLGSMKEVRERVVAMDQDCHASLGTSPITISEWVSPTVKASYMTSFLVCFATFVAYSQRSWFAQGQLVDRILGTAFARFSWQIQPYLILGLVVIHGAELAMFSQSRLAKHGVNPRTRVWWMWAATFFLEGVFGVKRFDELVGRKKEEREKAKH